MTIMKTNTKIWLLSVLTSVGLMLVSCDNVFDELSVNPNQQDVSSFYNTPENINKGVIGIYSYVTTPRAMGVSASRLMVNRGDESSDRTDYGVPGQYCASLTSSFLSSALPAMITSVDSSPTFLRILSRPFSNRYVV